MFNIESLRLKKNKIIRKTFSGYRKRKLRNYNFTIISNNCWGGMIYESYNLPKMSPTVGLFFEAKDYIKFISKIKYYLKQELKFIDVKQSNRYKNGNDINCIVGMLDDVELYFLHYKTKEEVLEKWSRRIKRINYDNILYKFNDQNGCTEEDLANFLKLPYKNKIFFTIKDFNIKNKSIIKLKKKRGETSVVASQEPFGSSKYINVNDLINNLKK